MVQAGGVYAVSLVIYKDGKLYADTKAWGGEGSRPSPGAKDKVYYAEDGAMIGVTSAVVNEGYDVVSAYNRGKTWIEGGSFCALVVKPGVDGYFFWNETAHITGPFREPFFAVGTGAKYALGALEAGGSIEDAFRAASKYDYFSDSVFRTFGLENAPAPKPKRTRSKTPSATA